MAAPRILILRGGAIGDVVVTLPVLQALRERWPDSRIEVATYPRMAPVLLDSGLADACCSLEEPDFSRLFSYRPSFSPEFRRRVQAQDLIFTFLYDPDELVGRNLEGAGARQVFGLDPRPVGRHASDHLASILHPLALYPEQPAPRLAWPRRNPPAPVVAGAVALHPGSGSPAKNWPWPRFLALARRLEAAGIPFFFIEGEAESETLPALATLPHPVLRGVNLAGVCDALRSARAFVGNDSGLAHLAAALGVPTTVLFGPSDPALWAPRGLARVDVLRKGDSMEVLDEPWVWEQVRHGLG